MWEKVCFTVCIAPYLCQSSTFALLFFMLLNPQSYGQLTLAEIPVNSASAGSVLLLISVRLVSLRLLYDNRQICCLLTAG